MFVKKAVENGMDIIRIFDALNDVNNLKWSGQCIHDAGLNHEVVVTMMGLPPGIDNKGTHTPEFYRDRLKMIMDAGIPFDRVAFKDASGPSTPAPVYNTMKLARQLLGKDISNLEHLLGLCLVAMLSEEVTHIYRLTHLHTNG